MRQTYMQPGAFDVTKTIVSIPKMAGSGLSGEYVLPVRQEVELRLQTYDQYKNPILSERAWTQFSVQVA
jgi:hypothetical protein